MTLRQKNSCFKKEVDGGISKINYAFSLYCYKLYFGT